MRSVKTEDAQECVVGETLAPLWALAFIYSIKCYVNIHTVLLEVSCKSIIGKWLSIISSVVRAAIGGPQTLSIRKYVHVITLYICIDASKPTIIVMLAERIFQVRSVKLNVDRFCIYHIFAKTIK